MQVFTLSHIEMLVPFFSAFQALSRKILKVPGTFLFF